MRKADQRKHEHGMSLIEILPVVIVVTTLFSFLLGAWGIAHKHTLSSIAARTYTFETLNHRSNVMYFSDARPSDRLNKSSYEETELRYHGHGYSDPQDFSAPMVPIRYTTDRGPAQAGSTELHRNGIWQQGGMFDRNREIQLTGPVAGINHVWVTVGYGICINTRCGGN
jgi:hypothetical protein